MTGATRIAAVLCSLSAEWDRTAVAVAGVAYERIPTALLGWGIARAMLDAHLPGGTLER
jgi:hypothetical protein